MTKYLNRLQYHRGNSLMGELVETAEQVGASFAYGYVQNRYREKASVAGVPLDLGLGAALKALGLGLHLAGKGHGMMGMVAEHADLLGNAGLMAHFHTMGAGMGAQKSGVTRVLVDKKDVGKVKATLPHAEVLGEIPRAPHGDFLSTAELEALARSA